MVTDIDIKTFLEQAFSLDLAIKIRKEEIAELESILHYSSPNFSSDYIDKTPTKSREDLMCKIIDFKANIDKDVQRLIELKNEIYLLINTINNERDKSLMILRYIKFKTWSEVAEEMEYEDRHVMRLHKNILHYLETGQMLNSTRVILKRKLD